jgi:hypothetical protein
MGIDAPTDRYNMAENLINTLMVGGQEVASISIDGMQGMNPADILRGLPPGMGMGGLPPGIVMDPRLMASTVPGGVGIPAPPGLASFLQMMEGGGDPGALLMEDDNVPPPTAAEVSALVSQLQAQTRRQLVLGPSRLQNETENFLAQGQQQAALNSAATAHERNQPPSQLAGPDPMRAVMDAAMHGLPLPQSLESFFLAAGGGGERRREGERRSGGGVLVNRDRWNIDELTSSSGNRTDEAGFVRELEPLLLQSIPLVDAYPVNEATPEGGAGAGAGAETGAGSTNAVANANADPTATGTGATEGAAVVAGSAPEEASLPTTASEDQSMNGGGDDQAAVEPMQVGDSTTASMVPAVAEISPVSTSASAISDPVAEASVVAEPESSTDMSVDAVVDAGTSENNPTPEVAQEGDVEGESGSTSNVETAAGDPEAAAPSSSSSSAAVPAPAELTATACPPGMDPEVFEALPDFMREELLAQMREEQASAARNGAGAGEAAAATVCPEGMDQEVFDSLPEEMRRELVEQQVCLRSHPGAVLVEDLFGPYFSVLVRLCFLLIFVLSVQLGTCLSLL